jgi:hypothetical protein
MSTFIVFGIVIAIIAYALNKMLPGKADKDTYADLPQDKLDAYNFARKMIIIGILFMAGVPALLIFTLFAFNNMSFIAQ